MIKAFKRSWHKAQALSVLQNAFHQPLKEPLTRLTDAELKSCVRIVMDAGGTPFDSAISYMILKFDARLRNGEQPGGEAGTVIALMGSLRPQVKLYDQHMIGMKRMGEWSTLLREGKPLPVLMTVGITP